MDNKKINCNGYEAMYTFLSEEDFQKHLLECEECAKEHAKMQRVSELIQEAKPYIIKKKKNIKILAATAAFFIAVFTSVSVPLCMVGANVYENISLQNTPTAQEQGLPVDEYGFIYVE